LPVCVGDGASDRLTGAPAKLGKTTPAGVAIFLSTRVQLGYVTSDAALFVTGLLAKIRPAVEATQYQGERSATNYGFVDAVARKNVELTMIDIHRRSAVLADLETSGAIKIAGAMYNLDTGRVEFFA
jgi:carbonic anhydrase